MKEIQTSVICVNVAGDKMLELRPKTNESFCTEICKQYYHFGCDWDKRCKCFDNNNERINICVNNCPNFKKGQKQAEMLKEQLDNDFNDTKVTLLDERKASWLVAIFSKYNPNKQYWDDRRF